MSLAEVSIRVGKSYLEGSAGIGPAKRLTEDPVEIVNEIEHAGSQILERRKASALEQSSGENGKPDLDLVEPGTMPRRVDEADAMHGILQEFAARQLRLQDAGLTFDTQVVLNATALSDPFDEGCRVVGIELVGNEDLSRVGISFDGGGTVGREIGLGACESKGRADDFASDYVEVCDQTQGAMPVIFELDALGQTGAHGFVWNSAFQRLHPGFLIHTHDMCAFAGPLWRIAVGVAQSLDIGLILVGRFSLVLRCEPVLTLVRSQGRSAKKRSTCRGEILSTRLRRTASRANSLGVQCDTGKPLSAGSSHANAMRLAICSALNLAGAPLRAPSVNRPTIRFSRSAFVAPAASATLRASMPRAQRCRHRRTSWRSTPSDAACVSLYRPAADNSTTRHRFTNCCVAFWVRVKPSRISCWRGVNVIATDLLPIPPPTLKIRAL